MIIIKQKSGSYASFTLLEHQDRDKYQEQVLRTQWESVLVSVSLKCERLHAILDNPCFICLSIYLVIGQCKHTIRIVESNLIDT